MKAGRFLKFAGLWHLRCGLCLNSMAVQRWWQGGQRALEACNAWPLQVGVEAQQRPLLVGAEALQQAQRSR